MYVWVKVKVVQRVSLLLLLRVRIIIEAEGVSFEVAKEALRLAAQKLPVTTKFIVRRDYDVQNQNA